jgi:hypothetical protein
MSTFYEISCAVSVSRAAKGRPTHKKKTLLLTSGFEKSKNTKINLQRSPKTRTSVCLVLTKDTSCQCQLYSVSDVWLSGNSIQNKVIQEFLNTGRFRFVRGPNWNNMKQYTIINTRINLYQWWSMYQAPSAPSHCHDKSNLPHPV